MIEIERKFLIRMDKIGPLLGSLRSKRFRVIHQGYLHDDVRIRDIWERNKHKFVMTVKRSTHNKMVRKEVEFDVPPAQGECLMSMCHCRLKKKRYLLDGWEIDEYLEHLSGLWVAERELSSVKERFKKPSWIGKEVTSDQAYSNLSLALKASFPKEGL